MHTSGLLSSLHALRIVKYHEKFSVSAYSANTPLPADVPSELGCMNPRQKSIFVAGSDTPPSKLPLRNLRVVAAPDDVAGRFFLPLLPRLAHVGPRVEHAAQFELVEELVKKTMAAVPRSTVARVVLESFVLFVRGLGGAGRRPSDD